ncbi:MAG: cell division protein SepF [Clostridia bacterium]|nr:cell division protein SepF [Clostridia bacterium]
MKVLNYVYRFLGFESDDVKVVKKRKTSKNASYNLKETQKLPNEIDGVRVFYPTTLAECKDKVELLKKNTPFFLDFRGASLIDKNKILDYYDGVLSVLDAKYDEVDRNLFVFLPKDMELDKD